MEHRTKVEKKHTDKERIKERKGKMERRDKKKESKRKGSGREKRGEETLKHTHTHTMMLSLRGKTELTTVVSTPSNLSTTTT